MEATDVNARWQAEMARVLRVRSALTRSSGSRRCSTLSELTPPIDLGADERPRRARAASTASGSTLEEVHRFANRPVRLPDGLRWNLLHLFTEALGGAARARARSPASASTPGASTTRCSTSSDRVLGLPFHYRDDRTDGMIERAHARVPPTSCTPSPASRRCRSTPSSSCWPTRARRRWRGRTRIALVPDLLACG